MLCEVVSHGKVCDEQGKESFGDVLKFKSEQELTNEERLGCQRTSRSWVFFTCAAEGTSKSEKKVEIERRRPRLIVWIFSRAQFSVMESRTSSKTRLLVVDGTFLSPEEEIRQILNERAQG